jgi:hypothetical protein
VRLVVAWLLFSSPVSAKDTLRLQELPSRPTPPRALVVFHEDLRTEPTVVVLTQRAQQLTEPRSQKPVFVPLLGTTSIGGSLRLDF